jgi:hypothetical protein
VVITCLYQIPNCGCGFIFKPQLFLNNGPKYFYTKHVVFQCF